MKSMNSVVRLGTLLAGTLSAHTAFNVRLMRRPSAAVFRCEERVSVCIPARNEADNIARCLRSVLASIHVDCLEVLVLDDGSTDDTAAIVEALLHGAPTSSRLVPGGDSALPAEWLGKAWACERLRRIATGDVLVFLDADVELTPGAVAAAVAIMRHSGLDLVSPYPRQLVGSVSERLVQPLLQWLWLTFLPLRLSERSRPNSTSAANGQFLVVDGAALHAIDGFASVRANVLDDVALVRAMKRAGFRGTVVDGSRLATCRMYTGWSSLKDGYAKNLWAATGSTSGAVALATMLTLAYLIPPLGMLWKRTRRIGLIGYLFGVGGRVMTANASQGSVGDSIAHPLSVGLLLRLLAGSWVRKSRGTLTWKGRPVA